MTKLIHQSKSKAVTVASIERTQTQVERAIALAFEPEEVINAYEMAAACRLLAKQVDASKAIQNKCAASHTKAVRKVGELTQRMREEGVLARNGGRRVSVARGDTGRTWHFPQQRRRRRAAAGVVARGYRCQGGRGDKQGR